MKILSIIGIILFSILSILMLFNLAWMTYCNYTGLYNYAWYIFLATVAILSAFIIGLIFSIGTLKRLKN